jgi:CRISPR/Cas system-associated endonuclease Cas1
MALEKNQLTYSSPISLYYGAQKSKQQLHWLDHDQKLVVKLVISKLQTLLKKLQSHVQRRGEILNWKPQPPKPSVNPMIFCKLRT